ncbi:MAG: hypothetical protein IPK60_23180 [Sandaracinaceae bacterium]|nr:hypothetical protein [Sandaracinaceae bacterium]
MTFTPRERRLLPRETSKEFLDRLRTEHGIVPSSNGEVWLRYVGGRVGWMGCGYLQATASEMEAAGVRDGSVAWPYKTIHVERPR